MFSTVLFDGIIASMINEDFAKNFAFSFLSVLFEGLPFIFIGTLISGFIDVYLPSGTLEKFLPKNRWLSIFTCGLMGLVVPVCECTVVPVIRRLVGKGLPVGSAFAYMLAAPIVNPITFMSTYTAFAGEPMGMALSRMLLGYLVAVTVGILIVFLPLEKILRRSVIERLHFSGKGHSAVPATSTCSDHACCEGEKKEKDQEHPSTCSHQHSECDHDHEHHHEGCDHHHHHEHKPGDKLVGAIRTSVRDFIDVAVYFVIGITLVTIFKKSANTNQLLEYLSQDGKLIEGTAFMIGLSFVLSLCSTSDAFVAATSFERIGRVPKMAFLVFGPMMDVKLMFLYQTLMKMKTVLLLTVVLFVLVLGACLLWGVVYVDVLAWCSEWWVKLWGEEVKVP